MTRGTATALRHALLDPLATRLEAARTAPAWHAPGGDRWLAAIAAVSLALAALLLASLGPHGLFTPINRIGPLLPNAAWASLTSMGGTLTALVPVLIFARRYPALLWAALIALLIGGALSQGLKELLDTARPPAVLPPGTFHLVGPAYFSHSTPSGHTITAFTLAGIAIRLARSAGWRGAWVLAATLVGISRVIVGAHWPLDVLLGAATGACAAWLTLRVVDAWPIGLRPVPHVLLVALWCLFAIARLVHPGAYADAGARPLAVVLAVLALVAALYGYVIRPIRATDAGGPGR